MNQSSTLISGVSANCNLALSASIPECYGELLTLLGSAQYSTIGNSTVMDLLCKKACPTALVNYRTKVVSACQNDPQPKPGYPATHWVDAVTSVQTQICLKDSKSGLYCTGTRLCVVALGTSETDIACRILGAKYWRCDQPI